MERYEKVSAVGFLLLYSSGVHFVDGIMGKEDALEDVDSKCGSSCSVSRGPPPRVCYATYGFPESLGEPRAPRPRDLVRSSRVIPANLHYSRPL